MRTFDRYINRRNITDPHAYFAAKGITTDEQLHKWCENHEVEPPSISLFGTTPAQEAPEPAPKKAAAAKKASAKTNKKTGKQLKKKKKRIMPSKYNKPRGLKTKRR